MTSTSHCSIYMFANIVTHISHTHTHTVPKMELLKLPPLFPSWFLILVFVLHCCSGCVENERIALIEIKLSYGAQEPINRNSVISSWNKSIDCCCCCCPGVHCLPITGLNLKIVNFTYGTNRRPLNFSLFLPSLICNSRRKKITTSGFAFP